MKNKKLTALLLTTAMVVVTCVPAFAGTVTSNDAGGKATVEYDDSEAVAYDSVTLPTSLTSNTYAFEIDPYKMISDFGAEGYDENSTVFFSSVDTPASITGVTSTTGEGDNAVTTTVTLYTMSYAAQTATNSEWADVITELNDDTDKTVKTVAAGYYVWTPLSTAPTGYTGGTAGQYTELTEANITNWFSYDKETMKIKLLPDYKAGTYVCDGKLYKATYTPANGNKISDSNADPLSNYITLTSGNVTAVSHLYKNTAGEGEDPVYAAATKDEIVYTPATTKHSGTSAVAYAVNKSTVKKVITATVTLENAGDLDINGSDTFTGDKADKASIYIAAMNGSTAVPLTKDAETGVISASIGNVELTAATDNGETLYQKTGTNPKTGGHTYGRYSGPNPTTTNHSFSIKAAANGADGAKDAWAEWAKTITADTRPTLKVVYSIADYVAPPTSFKVTFMDGDTKFDEQDVESGSTASAPSPAPTKAEKNFAGWYEKEDGEFKDTAFDFSSQITEAITLYAKWNDPVTGYVEWGSGDGGRFWLGANSSTGFGTDEITTASATVDGNPVNCSVVKSGSDYWVVVAWDDCKAVGVDSNATECAFTVTVAGTTYAMTWTE
jgi:uncharacterized repeat protein (TIGR02543 family)